MGERKERVKVRDEGEHIPKENTKHNVQYIQCTPLTLGTHVPKGYSTCPVCLQGRVGQAQDIA